MIGRTTAVLLLLGLVAGCESEEVPAVRVGSLSFTTGGVAALPPSSLPALGDVAAWGLAVRDGRQEEILAPVVQRARERSRLRTLPYVLGAAAMGLSEGDLRTAYEAAPEWELEVRHIIRMADAEAPLEDRLQALEEAEEALRRAEAGEDFASLAGDLSEEPGAAQRGGLLQPGREGTWVDPFWSAALALEPGELSPVVETRYGFHVLRLEDRRQLPFEEADRTALLRRLVPEREALAAMEEWAPGAPAAELPSGVVDDALRMVGEAEFQLDRALVQGEGWAYTGEDLAAGWASTTNDERQGFLRSQSGSFDFWLEEEVRQEAWVAEAERLGAPVDEDAVREEVEEVRTGAARWSVIFGFTPEMSDEELRAAAIRAVSSRGQEYRIARQELEALRPLLRTAYPVDRPAEAELSSSSSEMVKSASTG